MAKQFNSSDAFAREVVEFQRKLEREYALEMGRRSAIEAQKIAKEEASRDLGGDPKFSGWAPELVTQVKQKTSGDTFVIPTKQSAGPWTVAEFGRNSALGPAQLRSGRRQRILKSGRLSSARGSRRRNNGSTAGKGTGSRAVSRIEREVADAIAEQFKRQLGRHFDVR